MDVEVKKNSQPLYLQDEEVKKLIKNSQSGDKQARDLLVEKNVKLVWSVVHRFMNRGYEADDLFQIGSIGLIKAIDKFDLSYNVKFSTYAVPMIIGEIQRFIRDDGTVKVSRSLKELANRIRRAKDDLTKRNSRTPTISELAQYLDVTEEEIILAEDANKQPTSIHKTVYEKDGDPITLLDQIADKDDMKWFDTITLQEIIDSLEHRDRVIIYLRYYRDWTQMEVANRLKISQVQVSRLEKKILKIMKESIEK